jgi:hypothetical protein
MGLIEAATWGVLGGLAAALVSVSGDVMSAGFKWPWRPFRDARHGAAARSRRVTKAAGVQSSTTTKWYGT